MKDIFKIRVSKTTCKKTNRTRYFYTSDKTALRTNTKYIETRNNLGFIFKENFTEEDKSKIYNRWSHKNLAVFEKSNNRGKNASTQFKL